MFDINESKILTCGFFKSVHLFKCKQCKLCLKYTSVQLQIKN